MKLEEGMYVRYISGFHHNKIGKPIVMIGKILKVDDYINLDTFFGGGVYSTKDFKKLIIGEPSHNIIDLIEARDLMYIDISPDDCGGIVVPRIAETLYELEDWKEKFANGSCILKRVVTHEQIESVEYKVGE